MRATKENILEYLKEIKGELYADGIVSLALFGSFARDEACVYSDIFDLDSNSSMKTNITKELLYV